MSDGAPIIIKKKKKGGHAAHHGGSWKVAYADFVTAMMAFFMVMWIMGLSDQTRAQIQGYFNDPLGFVKNEPSSKTVFSMPGNPASKTSQGRHDAATPAEEDENAIKSVEEKIKSKLNADSKLMGLLKDVVIKITPEGLRIELVEATDAAFFQTGKSALNAKALELIRQIAPVIGKSGREVVVEGHTDSRPYPGIGYTNWDLSSDRANALRRAMSNFGMADDQLKGVRAYADTRLEIPSDPYDPRNRRVSILLPFSADAQSNILKPKDELKEQLQDAAKSKIQPSVQPSQADIAPPKLQ